MVAASTRTCIINIEINGTSVVLLNDSDRPSFLCAEAPPRLLAVLVFGPFLTANAVECIVPPFARPIPSSVCPSVTSRSTAKTVLIWLL